MPFLFLGLRSSPPTALRLALFCLCLLLWTATCDARRLIRNYDDDQVLVDNMPRGKFRRRPTGTTASTGPNDGGEEEEIFLEDLSHLPTGVLMKIQAKPLHNFQVETNPTTIRVNVAHLLPKELVSDIARENEVEFDMTRGDSVEGVLEELKNKRRKAIESQQVKRRDSLR
jgi:hypothetical protein